MDSRTKSGSSVTPSAAGVSPEGATPARNAAKASTEAPRHLSNSLAMSPRDAAAALSIGTRLLWEMTNRGEIPCVRIGRRVVYPVAVLNGWLARQAEGGAR